MIVRRLPPLVLALVLGLLAALAVACGESGDEDKLTSPTRASSIKEELDLIAERVEYDVAGAAAAIRQARLPDSLAERLGYGQ